MPEKAEKRYAVLTQKAGRLRWGVHGIEQTLEDAVNMVRYLHFERDFHADEIRLVSMVPLEWGVTVRPKVEKAEIPPRPVTK